VTDSWSSELNAKSGGGLLGGSKTHALSQDVTNQVSRLNAGGTLALSAGGDLTAQAAQLSAGRDLSLSAAGTLSLLSVTDSSFASLTHSSSSGFWQSSVDKDSGDSALIQDSGDKIPVTVHSFDSAN